MEEVTIKIKMNRIEFMGRNFLLKIYSHTILGSNIITLLVTIITFPVGCKYTLECVEYLNGQDIFSSLVTGFLGLLMFLMSFMGAVLIYVPLSYRDFFAKNKTNTLNYEVSFDKVGFRIINNLTGEMVTLEYSLCLNNINGYFGIAMYHYGVKQRIKFFFPACLFTKDEKLQIKEWQGKNLMNL